jgi:NitT/TauT family transport system substrate-binding protein
MRALRPAIVAVIAACTLSLALVPARLPGADLPLIRVGTAQAVSLAFLPIQVGEAAGIWQREGLQVESSALRGDGQVQQALTSGNIEIGLGSGPGLGFLAKGVPAIGIAELAASPYNMALMVATDSPIKSAADLKGKRIGVTTAGSLTDWLAKQIAVKNQWGPTGISTVALGDTKAQTAALKTGEVDGFIAATELGYDMQEHQQGRILMNFGATVPHFITHVIFARNDFVAAHPDQVKKFLDGWFRSVAYMKTHRAQTISIAAKYEEVSEASMGQSYDAIMNMMSNNGAWDDAALQVLAASFVDLGILDKKPDPETLITRKFVPVHI